MTDLLTRDPNDTGDIPTVGETTRILAVNLDEATRRARPFLADETPADPGQATRNLAPYEAGLPPAFRRPDATGEFPMVTAGCRRFVPDDDVLDDDTAAPDELQGPQPKPRPLPKPQPKVDQAAAQPLFPLERVLTADDAYVGRHRTPEDMPADVPPGRFGWLRSVLHAGWAVARRSM